MEASTTSISNSLVRILFLLTLVSACAHAKDKGPGGKRKTYIVSVASRQQPRAFATAEQWHEHLVGESSTDLLIYNYKSVFDGFAAKLTLREARRMMKKPGVLNVLEQTMYHVHTTHTPEFLGLAEGSGLLSAAKDGRGVIVGVLDTGAAPNSSSFLDTSMAPPPPRWKGKCAGGAGFACNNKLIGARVFGSGAGITGGAVDDEGHGSHTASTIAGSPVANASIFGYANGTARGMAPRAWIAVYKVCWPKGCASSDILAAMDAAVADGVDIMSLSLGGSADDYKRDVISIGAYAASKKGIFVSVSAGNDGPMARSISNVAPWVTTVAAGSIDRRFPGTVLLGSGNAYEAVSAAFSGPPLKSADRVPLVYGQDVASRESDKNSASQCQSQSLDAAAVKGKIVVCDDLSDLADKAFWMASIGVAGVIFVNVDDRQIRFQLLPIPSAQVNSTVGDSIKAYISSGNNPTGNIQSLQTDFKATPAPVVATFSSRGPNPITQQILKPDITAPGVDILAAWTGKIPPTSATKDTRVVPFNIISGTSMSCPHISGIAALLKSAHPDWSPAAIRSAIMTTANPKADDGNLITDAQTGRAASAFDMGAGHVQAEMALNPGLIYELGSSDYNNFLCSIKYTTRDLQTVTRDGATCAGNTSWSIGDFNYPSFSVVLRSGQLQAKHSRNLTNVGNGNATYKVSIESPEDSGVDIKVEPQSLTFPNTGDTRSFSVSFSAASLPSDAIFGSLTWSDGAHSVRSPIVISTASIISS